MRFRTITAPDMQSAMAELRAQMGAGAIILNTEQNAKGQVVLRAAIEQDDQHTPDQLAHEIQESAAKQHDSAIEQISNALAFHRAPQTLAAALMHTVDAVAGDDAVLALAAAFDAHFRFSPLPAVPARPVMLIGPAGAGKTLTAAKLAARSLLAGNETMLFSTDTVRTGGAAQLAAYAQLMQRPLHTAACEGDLANLLQSRPQNTACFVDTAGASPFNRAELRLLKSLIVCADVEPVLVLSAGGDATEAGEIANLFSSLGARGLIVTRLDTTRRLGSLLSAMQAGAMTLQHVSITPYVADGLAPITPVALARIFLEDPCQRDSRIELERTSQ